MPRKLPRMETPIEAAKNAEKRISFSERWEEELKQKLFEEENSTEEQIEEILESKTTVHHKRPNELWDVPITEEIQYFDPELSYELTGYRPINMEQGLDFDPTPFRERAAIFERVGSYTEYPKGCKPYNDFWKEEYRRCQEGYTVGKYRITGDHYFFLNYYRMSVVKEGVTAGSGREDSFPGFLSKQYEFFHYVEMAEKLHKDVCILKARGIGLSEIVASLSVRPYTTNRNYNVLLTCAAEAKLTPLQRKCWYQLDWLNMNTNGGMRHLRQKVNNAFTKRASLLTPDGIEYGWMSQISSVVADTSDKIRGDRLDRLIYEEAGSNNVLTESWIKGDALVALGGYHFGTRIALGTGGDDMALKGLSDIFTNPEAYNVLPFKNYDTDDGRPEISSFFIPAHKFSLMSEYLDKRGVTDHIRFKKFYEAQRAKLTDKDFLNECAEHCFTPREALSKHGDNVFDAVAIAERMVQIKVQGLYTKPKRMQLLWDKSGGDGLNKVIARESPSSHLLVVEPPILDETGKPYKNLYVAGIDAIDMGRKDSATDNDVSDFCVVIKKRAFGMDDPKYVAMYKYRPSEIREAYDLTMKLLVWYNCKALLEYTKISIQTYFREKGKSNLFMSRPQFAITGPKKQGKQLVGVPSTPAVIEHGLELVANFINDYWFTIDYEEMLDQMLNYSYENKRKFDIIAALQMAEIADEELSGIKPTTVESIKNQWKDIGYYIDSNGYKRRGIIPPKQSEWRL